MKLFQKILVASSAIGLIAPVAAQATEIMNSYGDSETLTPRLNNKTFVNGANEDLDSLKEQLASLKKLVEGLETQQSEFEAGTFSDTTTMNGKTIFTLGAVEYDDDSGNSEAVQAYYSYTMNLNTSFTGDDNLYVRIKSGNGGDWTTSKTYGTYLSSAKGNSDVLKIDKIWYQFPLGENNLSLIHI